MNTNPIFARLASLAGPPAVRVLALLAIAVSATAISCTPSAETQDPPAKDSPATEHAGGGARPAPATPSAPVPSATDYTRVARLFGESLLAGQYPAAYDLTSSRLRGRMSPEKFSAACKQAVQQFGEAVQLGPVVIDQVNGLAGSAASREYGFPADIPDADRLAWVHAALALDVDEGEVLRCYDCWMLLENDGGKARIGHFKFTPCE